MIIEQYMPKNFGREYVELRGSYQYPMFVATALGLKPCFDDWVEVSRFDEFVKVCKEYGLFVISDVVFQKPDCSKEEIIGKEVITTTFTKMVRFTEDVKSGNVHIFVSKDKESAIEAKKFGWYTGGVIGNRSINKPFVDHLRFGNALGYPDCCINFFRRFNDWHRYSHPFETFKNTPKIEGKAKGSYYCNNFLMDNTYGIIHNLPCSYRCEKTIEYAKKLEEKFKEVEPEFIEKATELLKKPLLVFGERHFVLFDGKYSDEEIRYSDSYYNKNPARIEENIDFYDDIIKGDKISIKEGRLNIYKNEELLRSVEAKEQCFMMDWD